MSSTHRLTLPGAMIERGFWLYVWRIESPIGDLLYVGRTGDNSSANAATPFARMGQHLSTNKRQNPVRQHLERRLVQPETCTSFDLIAHGPIFEEAQDGPTHKERRDVVAALEKALADTLARSGYVVLNQVKCRHDLDTRRWTKVREAFVAYFPRLSETCEKESTAAQSEPPRPSVASGLNP